MIEKTTIEKPALKAVCSGCPAEKVIENNYAYGSPDEKFKTAGWEISEETNFCPVCLEKEKKMRNANRVLSIKIPKKILTKISKAIDSNFYSLMKFSFTKESFSIVCCDAAHTQMTIIESIPACFESYETSGFDYFANVSDFKKLISLLKSFVNQDTNEVVIEQKDGRLLFTHCGLRSELEEVQINRNGWKIPQTLETATTVEFEVPLRIRKHAQKIQTRIVEVTVDPINKKFAFKSDHEGEDEDTPLSCYSADAQYIEGVETHKMTSIYSTELFPLIFKAAAGNRLKATMGQNTAIFISFEVSESGKVTHCLAPRIRSD